ncbi:ArsR/SmtB family transcription factor [Arthrobacter pigmenti]
MEEIFEALADTNRRQIIAYLGCGKMSAGQLASKFPIAREGISKHLRILLQAGLVSVAKEGRSRIYRIDPKSFEALDRWLDPYRGFWEQRLDALNTEIQRGRHNSHASASTHSSIHNDAKGA